MQLLTGATIADSLSPSSFPSKLPTCFHHSLLLCSSLSFLPLPPFLRYSLLTPWSLPLLPFTLVYSLPSFLHFEREFGRLLSSVPACLPRLPPSYSGVIIDSVNLPFLPTQSFIIIICFSFLSSSSHHYRKDCFIIKEKVSKVSRSSLPLTRLEIQEVTQEKNRRPQGQLLRTNDNKQTNLSFDITCQINRKYTKNNKKIIENILLKRASVLQLLPQLIII